MVRIELADDFKEFLRLLNSKGVEYLLIGGYAVGYHGYPRATGDFDIWVRVSPDNARKTVSALREFGFNDSVLSVDLLLEEKRMLRMGYPPTRIEVLNEISGVEFESAYVNRIEDVLDGVPVNIISREDLIMNKKATGRGKDLVDVKNIP